MKRFIPFLLLSFIVGLVYAEMPTVRGFVSFKTESLQNTFYNLLDSNRIKCVRNAVASKRTISVSSGAVSEIYQVEFYMNFDEQYIADRNLIKQSTSTFKLNDDITEYKFEVWDSNSDGVPGQCPPNYISELLIK